MNTNKLDQHYLELFLSQIFNYLFNKFLTNRITSYNSRKPEMLTLFTAIRRPQFLINIELIWGIWQQRTKK